MKKQSEKTSRGKENSGRTMSWTKKHARKGEDYKTSPREPLYGTVHESLIYPSGWVIPNCEVFLFKGEPKRAARCQAEIFIPQSHKSLEQDAYKTRIKRYTPILFFPRDSNDMKHFLFEGEKSASRSFLPLTFSPEPPLPLHDYALLLFQVWTFIAYSIIEIVYNAKEW